MVDRRMLEELAGLYGIQISYYDIWGNRRYASDDTLSSLLAALGATVGTDEDVRTAAARKRNKSWLRPLPPAQVVREGDVPVRIVLSIPERLNDARLSWSLTEENGRRAGGELNVSETEILERHDIDGCTFIRCLFMLDVRMPPGYHLFEIAGAETPVGRNAQMKMIVSPRFCYQPDMLADGRRSWGPVVQLYSVRSDRNWGIGDFSDLRALVEWCSQIGAGLLGLNPLHALFPHNPNHVSPYSPSSRLFRNALYLDVEAVPDLPYCEEARQSLHAPEMQRYLQELRQSDLVQYGAVAAVKFKQLEPLYKEFRKRHLDTDAGSERGSAFRAFQMEGGEALYRFALFQSLQEHFHREDTTVWGWPIWPEPFRDPASSAVAEFAHSHHDRIEFYQYLQWEAQRQYGLAATRSLELGLGIGLYEDLALSVDRGGAEAWANQSLYVQGVSIGSPPDDSNLLGQNWGLPPMSPEHLFETGYESFIATLRCAMFHAGALRIDHVMGLMRLFWIPFGKGAVDGTYVQYPFEDLLGILALESQRNRCLIIGEDLGTVPDEVREAMHVYGIFSYRLFYYEKGADGIYKPPGDYFSQALVAISTHDMAPLAGFWAGRDLAVRTALNLFPSEEMHQRQVLARAQDRAAMLVALHREGLLPGGVSLDSALTPEMTPDLVQAIHSFVARTRSKVMVFQLEDVLGQTEQVNLPGTVDEHPNWRRKLTMSLEDIRRDQRLHAICESIRRGRSGE